MADAGATVTGLNDFEQKANAFALNVPAQLRALASRTAGRIQRAAFVKVPHREGHQRGVEISIEDAPQEKAIRVVAKAAPGRPANLPSWLEFGTVKMAARPYLFSSAESERGTYEREATELVDRLAREV